MKAHNRSWYTKALQSEGQVVRASGDQNICCWKEALKAFLEGNIGLQAMELQYKPQFNSATV